METVTPTISKKQQRKALSAKTLRKLGKNVLASPFSNYCPRVSKLHEDELIAVLQENLLVLKPEKPTVKWSEIKNIPKEQRKQFRRKFREDADPEAIEHRSSICFGINGVTKLLEKNEAGSILITANVHPDFMVKHILDMAVLQKRPVLLLPNLRGILQSYTGIRSVSIALKDNLSKDSPYFEIDQKIKEVSRHYPVPENHIHSFRANEVNDDDEKDTKTEQPESSGVISVSSDENEAASQPKKDVYLYRTCKKVRVFVPDSPDEKTATRAPSNSTTTEDFIPIGTNENKALTNIHHQFNQTCNINRTHQKTFPYRPLLAKRVKGNENRNKRKIELLKKSNK